jgi:hypothetical protein
MSISELEIVSADVRMNSRRRDRVGSWEAFLLSVAIFRSFFFGFS